MPLPATDILSGEQEHLTDSRAALRRMREHTAGLTAIGGDHVSTQHLKQALYRRMKALEDSPDVPLFFGRLDYAADLGRRAGRDALHRPPARDRRGRRRADGDRLAGRHVPALLPGAARPADGRTPAPPVRLLPRADDRVRGRGPGPSRGGSRLRHLGVGDRAPADRADARHRRHHPARAGRHRPRRPGPVAVHPGRPRHRQDGGRAAPRRLPAVRVPRPAQPVRGAGGRAQRQLLVLHRRRAARPGGDRREPGHGRLAGRQSQRRDHPGPRLGRRGADQGRSADGRGAAPGGLEPSGPGRPGARRAPRRPPVAGRRLPRRRDDPRTAGPRCPLRGRSGDAAAPAGPPGAAPDGGLRRLPRRPGAGRRGPQQAGSGVRRGALAGPGPGEVDLASAERRGLPRPRRRRHPQRRRATVDLDGQAGAIGRDRPLVAGRRDLDRRGRGPVAPDAEPRPRDRRRGPGPVADDAPRGGPAGQHRLGHRAR